MANIDIYKLITDRILSQLEKGIIPWKKPWIGQQAINYITRKPYRGINTLLLENSGEYLTFKQCKDLGGNIKKGEKSNIIVFYKTLDITEEETEDIKKIPYLKYSNVFHISQCDGIETKLEAFNATANNNPIEQAERITSDYISRENIKLNIVIGSDKAFYKPSEDSITLPHINQFTSNTEYYSTAFHELAHSTGHTSRLNRIKQLAHFGNQEYSREELIGEISSAMLMNILGIEQPATFKNSVSYIKNWSKKLKEDVRSIVNASSQAQKAVDFILK